VCKSHEAVEVDADFVLELAKIKLSRVGHVVHMLNAGIEEDAVDIRKSFSNTFV
jgi:hypothetical protein